MKNETINDRVGSASLPARTCPCNRHGRRWSIKDMCPLIWRCLRGGEEGRGSRQWRRKSMER
uniref:Uncharacterized protein n=1 Tax=Ascaris lumbricoides TaxID=6252 RepID=A0A0M3HQX8_ASCLU